MDDLRDQLVERLRIRRANLADLEEQKAKLGLVATPAVNRQIEDERAQIEYLEEALARLADMPGEPAAAVIDAGGRWLDYRQKRLEERVTELRRELMGWQASVAGDMADMAERQLDPLNRQMAELATQMQRLVEGQSAMRSELQRSLAQLEKNVALNNQRLDWLERRGAQRDAPVLPRGLVVGAGLALLVILALMVFVTLRLL